MLRIVLALLALSACDRPAGEGARRADGLAYARALSAIRSSPSDGLRGCEPIRDPAMRADCRTAAAEQLAPRDLEGATRICEGIEQGLWQDECWFQVAERAGQPWLCLQAGRFSEDCRMHLWTAHLIKTLHPDAGPAEVEQTVRREAPLFVFTAEDDRPWVAAFRLLASRMQPLDRSSCDALGEVELRRICRDSMLHHYNDLLNHARDTRSFPCDGGPMPKPLLTTPDPEIDALVGSRHEGDLCP